ncbi:adenylosuccinate synthetase [Dokdonia sinensis]|uniref:Adenylosuccinate synthetase n=1 Tax=Dokdonia sinensis TaxID=2479847 RepID=A0A3M0FZH9_9FLAO|nr:adenylosuccinate synthetase [Dokdonia sinensis]RMB57327.1 adenylosuccinate synthetase [Dokdonia sinensis]
MQIPTDVPKPHNNSPIDPSSPIELIVFIVLPILLIVTYIIVRKRRRDKRNKDKD